MHLSKQIGTVWDVLDVLHTSSLSNPQLLGEVDIILIAQQEKLRCKEVKNLTQGHMTSKGQSQDSKSGWSGSQIYAPLSSSCFAIKYF